MTIPSYRYGVMNLSSACWSSRESRARTRICMSTVPVILGGMIEGGMWQREQFAVNTRSPRFCSASAAFAGACKIATQMSGALSSTAQDMLRGKRTEIDSLNGYISRRGEELGVATPINHALYTMIKLAEGRI